MCLREAVVEPSTCGTGEANVLFVAASSCRDRHRAAAVADPGVKAVRTAAPGVRRERALLDYSIPGLRYTQRYTAIGPSPKSPYSPLNS